MMIRTVNLMAVANAFKELDYNHFCDFLGTYGVKASLDGSSVGLREYEMQSIHDFVSSLQLGAKDTPELLLPALDEFYVGYKIPNIGKEFDLLRIESNRIINIEIKSQLPSGGFCLIEQQLRRNKYYLSFIRKQMILYTFVADSRAFYYYNTVLDCVTETDSKQVLGKLGGGEGDKSINIDTLFNPSQFLVSPFNNVNRFLAGEYFLTQQQEEIKQKILTSIAISDNCFFALSGGPGTGKSLLLYDIAKALIDDNKRVRIIHCGVLNDGHKLLNTQNGWDIIYPKQWSNDKPIYDVVIIDEVQRLYPDQFNTISDYIIKNRIKCIMSFDDRQCLSHFEKEWNIPDKIKSLIHNSKTNVFPLKRNFRITDDIIEFIQCLFNNHHKPKLTSFDNVSILYYLRKDDVLAAAKYYQMKGWTIPNYTPGTRSYFPYEEYSLSDNCCAHSIIGQEFEKELVIIDNRFYYDDKGNLSTELNDKYYSQSMMLYQIMTRAKQQLKVIIYNNALMMSRCLDILNH